MFTCIACIIYLCRDCSLLLAVMERHENDVRNPNLLGIMTFLNQSYVEDTTVFN